MIMVAPFGPPLLSATQHSRLLRDARKRRGLPQTELGARPGLRQKWVSHPEDHAVELSVKQLLSRCTVMGWN
jgi:hypothetical protein